MNAERARQLINYDPETGSFTWKLRISETQRATNIWKSRFAGQEAGVVSRGYRLIRIDNELHAAHRIAWLIMTGSWPEDLIDHIDMNGLNNCWSNLRQATKAQNMQNRGPQKNNKSGFKGIRWEATRHKYAWECRGNGIRLRGRCDTFDAAIAAYKKASAQLHGEFWRVM